MPEITENLTNIERCWLENTSKSGRETEVLTFSLALTTGAMPMCSITISGAAEHYPAINDSCDVWLKVNGRTLLLFGGYIAETTESAETYASGIQHYRTYRIACHTEAVDSLPPTTDVYLNSNTGNAEAVKQGFVWVNKQAEIGAVSAKNTYRNCPNIIKTILGTFTTLSTSISNTKGSFDHYFKSPAVYFTYPPTDGVVTYIIDRIKTLIKGGATYIQALTQICDEFLLTLVPVVTNRDDPHMKLGFTPAFGKKPATKLTTSDYTFLSRALVSQKNRKIDGIIMPLANFKGNKPTTVTQYVVYGRIRNGRSTMEIVDHKTVEGYFNKNKDNRNLRFKYIPIPGWADNGLMNHSNWKAILADIARTYYALYAYSASRISLAIPLERYWSLRGCLGEIIEVETFKNAKQGLDKGRVNPNNNFSRPLKVDQTTKMSVFRGQLTTLTLNINVVGGNFRVSSDATLGSVRLAATDALLFPSTPKFLYKL